MNRLLWRSSVRHLLAHPWQVGLSILGIALGVAVVVSVDLANESARRAFMGFAESLAGRATHRIVGGPSGLPEDTYVRLRLSGVRAVAPVVERDVSAVDVPGRTFHLLGIDPFAEAPFRSFVTAESASGARPLAVLLTRPATALIAQATAAQLGLRPGDSLVIRAGARRHRVELVGGVSAPREIKWLPSFGIYSQTLSGRDGNHRWAIAQAARLPPPWMTCESVFSEAFHLLGRAGASGLAALLRRRDGR